MKVHRVTDTNTAGAPVVASLQSFVRDNGQLMAVDGSPVEPHVPFVPLHSTPHTANGLGWWRINGIPVNVVGNPDDCGHPRADTGALTNING